MRAEEPSFQRSAISIQQEEEHAHAEPWAWHPAQRYTRRRKCRKILRDVKEPRCPKCGERI
jgi:hypothetical protein